MTATTHLRGIGLFTHLREAELAEVARVAQIRDYPKNSLIRSRSGAADSLYVVVSGRVKSMLIAEDGREVILAMLGPGEFFGEMALLDEDPSAVTAIAVEDSRLLVLRRDDLYREMMALPGMAIGLLRSLSRRLQDADYKIGGLVLLDVPGRIAHLLLQLADQHDGRHLPNPPTRQVMAQMVGSTRETVSRVLGEFASHGIVATRGGAIEIRNREALELATGHMRRTRSRPHGADGRLERRRES
jgi:CRP/FNR family transcriptional regulator, cyclic AMP receptor protein